MTLSGMCADHRQALPPGHRVGQCRLLGVLGVGGFGVTYLGEHAGIGHRVAVKEYFPNEFAVRDGATVQPKSPADREGFEWGLSRFVDEARTLSRFRHPNLVRVSDCFKANNTAYIVMDYEDGEPLDVLLGRRGTLTEAQLRRVVLPIADGLRQVHAAGFLHRDVKPANIHIRRSDESPVLLDFGVARQSMSDKSRSMTVIASAGYSPPEQYAGQGAQGPWTDVYALSALCRRAMTGRPPMDAPSRQREMLRSQADPLPKLADAGIADYSPALLAAVDWGLRVVETERPQSLDEWLAMLKMDGAREDGGEAKDAASGRGLWTRLAVVAVAASLVVGLTTHVVLRQADDERGAAIAEQPFTVRTSPSDALVEIVGGGAAYRAGMLLAPGGYRVRVSAPEYETRTMTAQHGSGPTGISVELDKVRQPFTVRTAPMEANVRMEGVAARYRAGMLLPWGEYQVTVSATGHQTETRTISHSSSSPTDIRIELNGLTLRAKAELGDAAAQYAWGMKHAKGDGVEQDYVKAAEWLRLAAAQGHAQSQFSLAAMHHEGMGVAKDDDEFIRWLRMAAEQGDAKHQHALGIRYAKGDGTARNYEEAAVWLRKAAMQGHAQAQMDIGIAYDQGHGVAKNAVEATRWFRLAAEQGLAEAQYSLGVSYANGQGVAKDEREAVRWYRKAAEQGLALAQNNLGIRYDNGQGIAKDEREAVRWYRKAADQGYADAQYNLGKRYANGQGVAKDEREAAKWYRKAADQGDADAQNNLGVSYANGQGVAKDEREAVRWYRKAAEQGLALAQNNLGIRYDNGQGIAKDEREAVRWYRKAADQGNAAAQYNLGVSYGHGQGVAQDHRAAVRWYRKAAEQGFAEAQNNLGYAYDNGQGVAKNEREAVRWYRKAAAQGHGMAQNNIGASYMNGTGVPVDHVRTYAWFLLAAANGVRLAENNQMLLLPSMSQAQVASARELRWRLTN